MLAQSSSPQVNPLYSQLKGREGYENLSPAFSLTLPTTSDVWGDYEIFTCGDIVKYEGKNSLFRIMGFTYSNGLILKVHQGFDDELGYGVVGFTTSSAVGYENVTREQILVDKGYNLVHKDGLIIF